MHQLLDVWSRDRNKRLQGSRVIRTKSMRFCSCKILIFYQGLAKPTLQESILFCRGKIEEGFVRITLLPMPKGPVDPESTQYLSFFCLLFHNIFTLKTIEKERGTIKQYYGY